MCTESSSIAAAQSTSDDQRASFGPSRSSDEWHDVKLGLRMNADRLTLDRLAVELDPFATEVLADGPDLTVRMLVPAPDSRTAADLALDLVEAGVCRSGGRLLAPAPSGPAALDDARLAVSA